MEVIEIQKCSCVNSRLMNDLKMCKELRSVYFACEAATFEIQQPPDLFAGNAGDTNRVKGRSDSDHFCDLESV